MMRKRPDEVFSKRAAHYSVSVAHADAELLAKIVEMCGPTPEDVAMDVGAGTFHTAMAIAPHVRKVVALDMTAEMLEEGIRLARERGMINIEPCLADAMSISFPDGSFDIVTCRRAAHHFTDIAKAIDEMRRVLRPGGKLLIDDRSVPGNERVDRFVNRLDTLHDPSHVREYSEDEWRGMLAASGLKVERVDVYRRNRPMSSYAAAVDDEGRRMMLAHLATADEAMAEALSLRTVDGDPWWDHFFLTVLARKV